MDLIREIAQRLGRSPETAASLLEDVVRNIRRKTTQGETAALRNVGTFEDSGAGLIFKPDPGLAEIVNAPFAGLPAIPLAEPVSVPKAGAAKRGDPPSARRKALRTRKRGPARNQWAAGIGLILIAAGVWFLLPDRAEPPAMPPRPAARETSAFSLPAEVSPETALPPGEAAERASETSDRADANVPAAAPDARNADPAPLRGPAPVDRARGGYTIVVASETNEARARNWSEIWREQGFRTIVLPHAQNGGFLYRVGVGQFDLLDDAARVRDALAGSELPRGAWVLRI